ncbi:unnamed protein product, partial [Cylicostephanus goldi]
MSLSNDRKIDALSISSSVDEFSHFEYVEDESTVGRGVTSVKVNRFGFDSDTALSEDNQATLEGLEVLVYQEFEREPLGAAGAVQVEPREEHYKDAE